MFWLRVCTLCVYIAACNVMVYLCPWETLRWSAVDCQAKGSFNDLQWSYTGDVLTVTGTGATAIPSMSDTELWKSDRACYEALRKISLTGITTIGANAFDNIPELKTVSHDKSVTNIRQEAFANSGLTSIDLSGVTSIGPRAFMNTANLVQSLQFNTGIIRFEESAFEGSGLKSVDLMGASVICGTAAFKDCKKLTSFKCQGISKIPDSLLEGCSALTEILPEGTITHFGKRCFYGVVGFNYPIISNMDTRSIGESAFEGTSVPSVDFTKQNFILFTVGAAAFKDCKKLTSFKCRDISTIPDSLLEGCSALTEILPEGTITHFGKRCFYGVVGFNYPIVSNTDTRSIGESAFEGTGIETVDLTVHSSSFSIGAAAFKDCKKLTSFKCQGISTIPDSLLEGCSALTEIIPAGNIRHFGKRCFYGVVGFNYPIVSNTDTRSIGESAFEGTSVPSVDLTEHDSYFTVGAAAFKDCKNLTSFKCRGISKIPDSMLEGCSALTEIIPEGTITHFGKRCFYGVVGFNYPIVTDRNTWSIGESAFEGTGIETVDLTVHLSSLTIGAAAFKDCKKLTSFKCRDISTIPDSLLEGCSALTEIIPEGTITHFGKRCFYGVVGFNYPIVTDWLTESLGESAFEGTSVPSVDLTKHYRTFSLDDSVFKDCKKLTSLVWSPSLSIIPNSCFEASGLQNLEIPATVTQFGEGCFRDCKSLTAVTYHGSAEASSSVFAGCDALNEVTVPDDYPYNEFGGHKVDKPDNGLSLGAKIGIGVGAGAFVIIVIVIVVAILFATGKIGGGKRDTEAINAQP